MTSLSQIRVQWTSTVGINGVSTFYAAGPVQDALDDIATFFVSCQALVPTDVTWVFPTSGNIINDVTGANVASWIGTAGGSFGGTGTGNYARPSGAVVNWHTGLFVAGRELRGKTFMVPLVSSAFDGDGNVASGSVSTLAAAGNALAGSSGQIVIYSPTGHTNGAVTSAAVPNLAVVLRSRRD